MYGIVVDPLKTIYWFIPKNACTTLKVYYAKLLGLEFSNVHVANFKRTNKILPEYFNFTIVRHPFQRLYSCWANKLAPGHPVANGFENDIDINTFRGMTDLFYSEMSFEEFALLAMGRKTRDDQHWKPQSKLVPKGVNFYKMEELPLRAFFPVRNADHTGGRWEDHFTDKVLKKALKYYAEDFSRYGYSI